MDEVIKNGECLVDICSEKGLFLANTFSEHKVIHRYTCRRRDDRSLIHHITADNKMKKDVLDAKVVRRMFQCSDQHAVMA